MIGATLGHYQITSQLGKIGMREVFQAKAQKLGPDVAIKFLPADFARCIAALMQSPFTPRQKEWRECNVHRKNLH